MKGPMCEHCLIDDHLSRDTIWAGVIQLRGVWLCTHHHKQAITIFGHLFSPEGARGVRRWVKKKGVEDDEY